MSKCTYFAIYYWFWSVRARFSWITVLKLENSTLYHESQGIIVTT
jgi:hypothetical protein